MATMQERLSTDPDVAAKYDYAHESYLRDRNSIEDVKEIHDVSAGGMPQRVKCLHVLVAHALAVGPGINPFGDEALSMLKTRGISRSNPCVDLGGNV